jgi:hypothetical protein
MNSDSKHGIQCSQFEALLADALDGLLPEAISRDFEVHRRSCSVCGPLYEETREGMLMLGALQEVEPPKNLVHNILAATSVAEAAKRPAKQPAAPQAGWLSRIWRSAFPAVTGKLQPRFVTSFAMAFFSLSLTLTLAGVKLKDLARIDWRPNAIGKAVVLQYTQVETKVVKYYENMRFVYEVESRVRELKKAAGSEENDNKRQEQPKEKKDKSDTSGRPEEKQEHYSQEQDSTVIAYVKNSNEGA